MAEVRVTDVDLDEDDFADEAPIPRKGIDAVGVLTVWMALVWLIPMRWVVGVVGAAGRPAVLFGYLLLGWWVASRFVPRMVFPGKQPIRWSVTIYLLVMLTSYGAANVRGLSVTDSLSTQRSLIIVVSLVGCTLLCVDGIPSRARLDTLLLRVLYLAAFSSFVGALQFFLTVDLQTKIRFPGLVIAGDTPLSGIDTRSGFNRVSGTMGHPIEFGSLMAMLLPIAIHYVIYSEPGWRRQARIAATGLIALSVPISISRSSTIALFIVAVALLLGWSRRIALRASLVGAAGVVMGWLIAPRFLGAIVGLFQNLDEDSAIAARTSDYDIVFTVIGRYPWLGRGPATFGPPEYILLDNEVLGTLASTGYIGLASVLVMYLVPIYVARQVVWTAVDDEMRSLAQAFVGALFAGLVVLYFVDMFFYATYMSTLFLMFGAIGALYRLRDQPREGVGPDGQVMQHRFSLAAARRRRLA